MAISFKPYYKSDNLIGEGTVKFRPYTVEKAPAETAVGTWGLNTVLKSDTGRNWYYVNGTFNYGGSTLKNFASFHTPYYDGAEISSGRAYSGTPYLQYYYAKKVHSYNTDTYYYEKHLDGTQTGCGIGYEQVNIGTHNVSPVISTSNVTACTFTITDGEDINNPAFIAWLKANATKQS